MATGHFICGGCGEEMKRAALHVDELGFFKSCKKHTCGTSDLAEGEYITAFSRDDLRNIRTFLGLAKVDQLSTLDIALLQTKPAFQTKVNGYSLSDFIQTQ